MDLKGKRLEYIIKIIQETLKDSPKTKIYANHKVENTSGRKREFDIFIESTINDFEIKIAIECKDYKNAIPVEKIEAFKGKCDRIPGINKKVFISSNGFQQDAINAAKEFGIELQIASALSPSIINGWFPINQIDIQILPGGQAQLFLTEEEEYLKTIKDCFNRPFQLNDQEITINKYLITTFDLNRNLINDIALSIWVTFPKNQQSKPFFVPFEINPQGLFIIDESNKKIKVTKILMNYQFLFVETPVDLKEKIVLKQLDGKVKANTLSIQLDDQIEGNFIRTQDNNTTLHINGPIDNASNLRVVAFSGSQSKIIKLGKQN